MIHHANHGTITHGISWHSLSCSGPCHAQPGLGNEHFAAAPLQEFSGRWIVEPDPSVLNSLATSLRYEVSIVPKWSLPSTLITTVVRCGLPSNVRAIANQAEKV